MIKFKKLFRKNDQKPYHIGVVLSGGAARGLAHLGVLKALEESNIRPDVISGVSAGAIAGALYADGKSPEEILEIFKANSLFDFARFTIPKLGFMSTERLQKVLEKELSVSYFNELSIPFYAAAADLNEGRITYFSEGELVPRIVASASIPVLFKPKVIDNITYVDGGVFDNLPRKPIEQSCDKLIGVHVNPTGFEEDFDSMLSIASRTFHLTVGAKVKQEKNNYDLFIEPEKLESYSLMKVSKADEIFAHGYNAARKQLTDELVRKFAG